MVILMNNLILWCSLQIVALYYINLNPQPSYDAQSWYEYQLVFLSRNTLVFSFTSNTRVYFFYSNTLSISEIKPEFNAYL